MKFRISNKTMAAGLALAGLFFSGSALADGCSNPFSGTDNSFVTPYGGADLACPSTGSGQTYKECEFTFKNGVVDSMTLGCIELGVEIDGVSVTNGIEWSSSAGVDGSGIPASDKIDAILTDSAQGGKGCLYSFGVDQTGGTKVGYQRNSGDFFPASRAVFCSDQVEEVTAVVEPPAVVEECVIADGESKKIHGVTFSCPEVPAGALRTIIVVKDTECDVNGTNCNFVPGYGFLGPDGTPTQGTIDFNNICQCQGPAVPGSDPGTFGVVSEECDLNPDSSPGDCVVGPGAEVPVDASIQNPKCFTVRGKRKCF